MGSGAAGSNSRSLRVENLLQAVLHEFNSAGRVIRDAAWLSEYFARLFVGMPRGDTSRVRSSSLSGVLAASAQTRVPARGER